MSWPTTTSAAANTASVAALSPAAQSKMWLSALPGRSSRITGAPGSSARSASATTGSGSYSTCDQLQRVPGRVPVLGHHERDLLALEAHLVGGQHGLRVLGQRGHPGQPARGQVLPGEHGLDPRVGLRRDGVDAR